MKKLKLLSGVAFNVLSLTFGVTILFQQLCKNGTIENALSQYVFGTGSTEVINTGKTPIRYHTWYNSVQDVLNGSGDVAKAAESEGAVLLKNDNNALPLNVENDKVSLFGVSAYDPLYSLDGAGEVKINADRQQFLLDELKRNNVVVNEALGSWYEENTQYYRTDYINIYDNTSNTNGKNAALNGAAWDVLPSDKSNNAYNTGIFVTGRMTNEGIDIMPSNVSGLGAKDNDYLKFTDKELSVLQGMKELKEQGILKKIIVLFDQANPVSEDLPEILKQYSVDAAMWIGFPGSDGLAAVSDLLVGKSSPSGGLSTTWFTSRDAHPSTAYFGSSSNVLIQEGIYLGYKYAETRYEDQILGTGNTASYDYGSQISYPFGYGLSYASFDMQLLSIEQDSDPEKNYDSKGNKLSDDKLRKEGDDYIAKVKVTNTSSTVSAKKAVEIYLQKPYTDMDKTDKVEKASVELVGFSKTKKLAPGESETVEVSIDANKMFASYDIAKNKYVLEEGTYYLSASSNSHEAINSILRAKRQKESRTIDLEKLDSEYGEGNLNQVQTVSVNSERSSSYQYYTHGGSEVTNLFDYADPNKCSGNSNAVTYMSRNDWTTTADNAKSQTVNVTGDMSKGLVLNSSKSLAAAEENYADAIAELGNEYPNYGQHRNSSGVAEVQLAEMVGVEYEDSQGATEESKNKWEYFMDQLTWEETCKLIGNGLRKTVAIESIGKPYTNDVNASNAISWQFDMSLAGGDGANNVGFAYHFDPSDRAHNPTGYPCEGIIAATFNKDIAYAVGQSIGEDGLWSGASGLYGFGLGLHRNPYHGRAGEYYSEDPYLAGTIGGYSSKGAQSKGMYVYNKHFILNDQETNRTGYNTWLSEQAMRETYLRPFELAIEIGDAMCVMNSFNRVGTYWSGNNYKLMTKCLRKELGMRGFAVTDYWRSGGMNLTYGLLAGTDLPDGTGAESEISPFGPDEGKHGYYAQAARRAAQRILYTVANSNAMNFIGEDTRIIVHDPAWFAVRDNIILASEIVFACGAVFFAGVYGYFGFMDVRRKLKKE